MDKRGQKRDILSHSLEEVDLALGGARLLPSLRQRAQVVDRTDDVVAALLLMMVMVTRVWLRRMLRRLLSRGVRLLKGGRTAVGAGMGDGEASRGGGGRSGCRDRTCGAVRAATAASGGASATARASATRTGTASVRDGVTACSAARAASAAIRAGVGRATAAAGVARCCGGSAERGIRGVLARVRDRRALAAGGWWSEEGVRQLAHAQRHRQRQPRRVGLQHRVEQRLQVRLGILVDPYHEFALGQLVHVLVHRHFDSRYLTSSLARPLTCSFVLRLTLLLRPPGRLSLCLSFLVRYHLHVFLFLLFVALSALFFLLQPLLRRTPDRRAVSDSFSSCSRR